MPAASQHGVTESLYSRYENPGLVALSSVELRVLEGVSSGLAVVCDVVILVALSYCLHSKRTGFKRYVSTSFAGTTRELIKLAGVEQTQ